MKFLLMLAGVLAVQATPTKRNCGEGVYVKDKYYEKQILKTGLDRPFLLAVDYETLYFNYNINEFETRSARLNLKTNEMTDILDIPNGFSHAVDSQNHLYVGTMDGIYTYDSESDESALYGAQGQFIWSLFFKDDVLYYSEFPSEILYTFSNGEPARFEPLEHTQVHYFLLDNDNNMIYSNSTGLYKQMKGSDEAVLYKKFTHDWDLRALTLDANGNVYAGLENGIYAFKKDEVKMEQVIAMHDVFGLTFDSNNDIIYADGTSVVKLIPSKNKNC